MREAPGVRKFPGSRLLRRDREMDYCLRKARPGEEAIPFLRLDSAEDNDRLAAYYARLGFEPCGFCRDREYRGILRQKRVPE